MKVAVEKFQELCGKEVLHDCNLVTIFWRRNVLYTLFQVCNQVPDNMEILEDTLFLQVFLIFTIFCKNSKQLQELLYKHLKG